MTKCPNCFIVPQIEGNIRDRMELNVSFKTVKVLKQILYFGSQNTNENTNCRFLNAVSYRLSATELRIGRTEELQGHPKLASDALSAVEVSTSPSQKTDEDSDAGDDAVIPSAKY